MRRAMPETTRTYRNLKVHHLLRKRAHLIIKAKSILAHIIRREDKVALSLFRVSQDNPVIGSHDFIVDLKLAARLNLRF